MEPGDLVKLSEHFLTDNCGYDYATGNLVPNDQVGIVLGAESIHDQGYSKVMMGDRIRYFLQFQVDLV